MRRVPVNARPRACRRPVDRLSTVCRPRVAAARGPIWSLRVEGPPRGFDRWALRSAVARYALRWKQRCAQRPVLGDIPRQDSPPSMGNAFLAFETLGAGR